VLHGALAHEGEARLQRLVDGDRRVVQLHVAGLHLGQVEDVVQQGEQVLARLPDVAEIVLLASVEVTEHPLQQDLGEADHGVQRRSQLVGHARQELRLVAAGDLELGALALELLEQPRVEDGEGRLAGEGLEQVGDLVAEATRSPPTDHQGADDPLLATDRQHEDGPPAGLLEAPQMGVELHVVQIDDLLRLVHDRRPTDEGLVERDVGPAQLFHQLGLGPDGRPDAELLGGLVEVVDRAAVRVRQLDRVFDDGGEHVVEVEAGAHRVANAAEGLELFDLAPQFRLPASELAHQANLLDSDRGLGSEGRQHVGGAISERVDLRSPHRQHADELLVEQHRYADDRAEPAEALQFVAAVFGIGEDVGDLLGTPVQAHPTHQRPPVETNGVAVEDVEVFEVFVREPREPGQAVGIALDQVELRNVGPAQLACAVDHRAENQVEVGGRPAEGGQNLAGGSQLLPGLIEVAVEPRDLGVDTSRPLARHSRLPCPPYPKVWPGSEAATSAANRGYPGSVELSGGTSWCSSPWTSM
jgi:hypothetical protein